jgi:hypothetical protein
MAKGTVPAVKPTGSVPGQSTSLDPTPPKRVAVGAESEPFSVKFAMPAVINEPPVMAPDAVTAPGVLKLPPKIFPIASTLPWVPKLEPMMRSAAVMVPAVLTAVPLRVIVAADPVAPDTK